MERQLGEAGLALHSWWSFDVAEVFDSPLDLYGWLAWGTSSNEAPSYNEVGDILEQIFQKYDSSPMQGKAVIPDA